jgi:hypothetical protein
VGLSPRLERLQAGIGARVDRIGENRQLAGGLGAARFDEELGAADLSQHGRRREMDDLVAGDERLGSSLLRRDTGRAANWT